MAKKRKPHIMIEKKTPYCGLLRNSILEFEHIIQVSHTIMKQNTGFSLQKWAKYAKHIH